MNRLTDPGLWARIDAFEIDPGAKAQSFADRLGEECGWDQDTTETAIEEYKRFVYLTQVSDRPVTPSVAVDLVWHLHLAYSESYWGELCRHVLGRPLHHRPTPGGKAAAETYREQYEHTLALYEAEFGETPPRLFWGTPNQRFNPAAQPRLYSPASHRPVRTGWLGVAVFGLIGLFFHAIGGSGIPREIAWGLSFIAGAMAVLQILGWLFRRGARAVGVSAGTASGVGLTIGISDGGGDGDGDGCGGGCGD